MIERSRIRRVALCVFVGAALAACGDSLLSPEIEPELQRFAALVNEHRASVGCPALRWEQRLAAVARAHSVDMVERDFFDHTNPDGASPFDRMRAADVDFSRAAENIAWGYGSPEAVLEGWLNSPGHRANLENCTLTEHGVGEFQTRWTHLFRTP